jgi:RNA polymerase sigma-19 factor, ECF subfamily
VRLAAGAGLERARARVGVIDFAPDLIDMSTCGCEVGVAQPGDLRPDELFDDSGCKLLRYLAARLKDGTEAADLAQEAYLRLLRADDTLLIQNPRGFALRVAMHVAYEWGRLARHRREHVGTDALEELASEKMGPFEHAAQTQQLKVLREALDSLAPMRRAVVLLHIRDGLTYAQIAAHVGLSISMVGRHLALGLEACRNALISEAERSQRK